MILTLLVFCVTQVLFSHCQTSDPCSTKPCHADAVCIPNALNSFQCICPDGWTGEDCSVDVDECVISSTPICAHGATCVNQPGYYECLCPAGFYGPRCETEVLECATDPCMNGGTCVDEMNGYRCVCPFGFQGDVCEDEVNECATSPCKNGAQCEDLIDGYRCHCLPGWTGSKCEQIVTPCTNVYCQNNATCLDLTSPGKNVDLSKSEDAFFCQCVEGYSGKYCELQTEFCTINNHTTDNILNKQCQNGGVCIQQNFSWSCQCLADYTGQFCELHNHSNQLNNISEKFETFKPFDCSNTPCMNNGSCVTLQSNSTHSSICQCPEKFIGNLCEISLDICDSDSNNCLNGASCEWIGGLDFVCHCLPGFAGDHCEISLYQCWDQPCGYHGVCRNLPTPKSNDYTCECLNNWSGMNCEIGIDQLKKSHTNNGNDSIGSSDLMTSSVLSNINDNLKYGCPFKQCSNGADCSISLYDTNNHTTLFMSAIAYLKNGFDADAQNNYTVECMCNTSIGNFEGDNCDLDINECELMHNNNTNTTSICMNGGNCINTYGSYFCSCPPEYIGKHCEQLINACAIETGQPICSNHGVCRPKFGGTVCECKKGFTGAYCEVEIDECSNEPCMNNGICLDLIGSYVCLCTSNSFGQRCEFINENFNRSKHCTSDMCQNGGTCLNVPNNNNNSQDYYCDCPIGYFGQYCEGKLNYCRIVSTTNSQPSKSNNSLYQELLVTSNLGHVIRSWSVKHTWNDLKLALYILNSAQPIDGSIKQFNLSSIYGNRSVDFGLDTPQLCNPAGTAQCLPDVGNFTCVCRPDYKGRYCDEYVDFCEEANRQYDGQYCLNDGRCDNQFRLVESNQNYDMQMKIIPICQCTASYFGKRCELFISSNHWCGIGSESPCLNGAKCVPMTDQSISNSSSPSSIQQVAQRSGYYCDCPIGWAGLNCEINTRQRCPKSKQKKETMMMMTMDAESVGCVNNMTNCTNESDHNHCYCNKPGYCGPDCDIFGVECFNAPINHTLIHATNSTSSLLSLTSRTTTATPPPTIINTTINRSTDKAVTAFMNITQRYDDGNKKQYINHKSYSKQLVQSFWPINQQSLSPITNCPHQQCIHHKRHNGHCDPECDLLVCDFDHGECLYQITDPLKPISVYLENENSVSGLKIKPTPESLIIKDDDDEIDYEETPRPVIPWRNCMITVNQISPCHLLFNNSKCDEECSDESCLFDGWDCVAHQESMNTTQFNSSKQQVNHQPDCIETGSTKQSVCNDHITQKLTTMSATTTTTTLSTNSTIIPGSLVLLLDCTPNEFMNNSDELLHSLSNLLHLKVSIRHHPENGWPMIYQTTFVSKSDRDNSRGVVEEKGGMDSADGIGIDSNTIDKMDNFDRLSKSATVKSLHLTKLSSIRKRTVRSVSTRWNGINDFNRQSIGSQVYLQLDSNICSKIVGPCFHSVDLAAQFLAAILHNQQNNLFPSILTVQSVGTKSSRGGSKQSILDLSIYVLTWIVCILLVLLILFGVLFTANNLYQKRHTDHCQQKSFSNQKKIKKILQAKVWYPANDATGNSHTMMQQNMSGNFKQANHKFCDKFSIGKSDTLTNLPSTIPGVGAGSEYNKCDDHLNSFTNHTKCSQFDLFKCGSYYNKKEDNSLMKVSQDFFNLNENCYISKNQNGFYDMNMNRTNQTFYSTSSMHFAQNVDEYHPSHVNNKCDDRHENHLSVNLPILHTFSESCDDSTLSSTTTTAVGNSSDLENQSENANNQTLYQLNQFLCSIPVHNLSNFQKLLKQEIAMDNLDSVDNLLQKEQSVMLKDNENVNVIDEMNFNSMCRLLTEPPPDSIGLVDHGSAKSVLIWQIAKRSLHAYRLLNLRLSESEETMLHLAARFNECRTVSLLLDAGSDFTTVDIQGRTPLLSAVSAGATESVRVLLTHPISGFSPSCYLPNALSDSTTPLIQAIKLGDLDIFTILLHAINVLLCNLTKANSMIPNPQSTNNNNNYDKLNYTNLIKFQTNPITATSAIFHTSPISSVDYELNYDENAINYLDINATDNLGRTALHWASVTDQSEIVNRLLSAGATYDAQTIHEETPLNLAAKEGALHSCRLLLLAGANPNSTDYLDRSPRDLADYYGHQDIVLLFDAFTSIGDVVNYTGNNNNSQKKSVCYTLSTINSSYPIYSSCYTCANVFDVTTTTTTKYISDNNALNNFHSNETSSWNHNCPVEQTSLSHPNSFILSSTTNKQDRPTNGLFNNDNNNNLLYHFESNKLNSLTVQGKLNYTIPNDITLNYDSKSKLKLSTSAETTHTSTLVDNKLSRTICANDRLLVKSEPNQTNILFNQIMGSDSESPNHWSSSGTSDLSPYRGAVKSEDFRSINSTNVTTHSSYYISDCDNNINNNRDQHVQQQQQQQQLMANSETSIFHLS